MTPFVKRLLILVVVVILGAAGTALKAGILVGVTNALGLTGRSAPKVAAVKPALGHKPAAQAPTAAKPAQPGTHPADKSAAATPAPIQASAGIGIGGPSTPAKTGAPAKAGTPAAKAGASPAPTPAPSTASTAAPLPAAASLTPPKSSPASASGPAGKSAASAGNKRAGGPAAEPFSDPTERLSSWVREPYLYTSLGRRDPFGSLLNGEFVGDGEPGLVDVGNLKLVGIAWDQADRFAMVEDPRGFGYALREGDPVRGGRVLRINRTGVVFLQTMGGETNTITIELPTQAQEGK